MASEVEFRNFEFEIIVCVIRGKAMKNRMKDRTKTFAKRIIMLCRALPKSREGRLIGNQLFRCGTSVAANYRASLRARSTAEFIAKLGIVEEEADETLFWLEILQDLEIIKPELLASIIKESDEIIAITVATIKSTKKKRIFNNQKTQTITFWRKFYTIQRKWKSIYHKPQ